MAGDRVIVALTTFCEASSCSPEERRYVVHPIFNRCRVNPVRYGKTPAMVCLKRIQFSEWNDDTLDNLNLMRGAATPESDPIWIDCLAAYDEVLAGGLDLTKGATHFHAKSIDPPYWTVGATLTLETAKLKFYTNVR
jgi:hypothetical protein